MPHSRPPKLLDQLRDRIPLKHYSIRTEQVYGDTLDPAACDDLMCGDFSEARYAWRKSEFKRLRVPIPFTGKQGFFEVPEDILAREME